MRVARTLALLALLYGCRAKSQQQTSEPTPEPMTEVTEKVVEAPAPVGFLGVLTPKSQAEVVAPFATNVKEYLVRVGDHVDKGAKLALLDDQPLLEQLKVTEADLTGAKAALNQAGSNLAIQQRAFKAGVASKAAVIDASGQVSQAAAKVKRAQAEAEAVKAKLKKTTLVAPIEGKVSVQYVKVGGQIEEGGAIVRVISSDELFLRFAVPQDQANTVAKDGALEISIESGAKQMTASAVVRSVSPELDPVVKMIIAEADLTGTLPEGLQAGLVCRVVPAKPK